MQDCGKSLLGRARPAHHSRFEKYGLVAGRCRGVCMPPRYSLPPTRCSSVSNRRWLPVRTVGVHFFSHSAGNAAMTPRCRTQLRSALNDVQHADFLVCARRHCAPVSAGRKVTCDNALRGTDLLAPRRAVHARGHQPQSMPRAPGDATRFHATLLARCRF